MRYLISYDIVNDRVRARASRYLCGYGERVQRSVFECDLTEKELRRVQDVLCALTNRREDTVRFYRLCAACAERVMVIGWGEPPRDDEGFEVV